MAMTDSYLTVTECDGCDTQLLAVETTWRGVPSSNEFLRRSSDDFRFPFEVGENLLCVRCVERRE